jgi:hypothetical protein
MTGDKLWRNWRQKMETNGDTGDKWRQTVDKWRQTGTSGRQKEALETNGDNCASTPYFILFRDVVVGYIDFTTAIVAVS